MASGEKPPVVCCSDCFEDFGLRRTAEAFGTALGTSCPNCLTTEGRKLSRAKLEALCSTFFSESSKPIGRGIDASIIAVNDCRNQSDLFGSEALNQDIILLQSKFGISCFYYGPPLWMFGKSCDEDGIINWEDADIQFVVDACEQIAVEPNATIYRVQLDVPEDQLKPERFCTPPEQFREKLWRFDSSDLAICYAAFDLETCLHETRVTLANDIYYAAMQPARRLKLLDLTKCRRPEGVTNFEDPAIWLRALLFDGETSYPVCRWLAKAIHERGFDGFIYMSYFQQAAARKHKNVALFGTPIVSADVEVSIGRVRITNMAYDWQFGPMVLTGEDVASFPG